MQSRERGRIVTYISDEIWGPKIVTLSLVSRYYRYRQISSTSWHWALQIPTYSLFNWRQNVRNTSSDVPALELVLRTECQIIKPVNIKVVSIFIGVTHKRWWFFFVHMQTSYTMWDCILYVRAMQLRNKTRT